jgi:hypothetical protein
MFWPLKLIGFHAENMGRAAIMRIRLYWTIVILGCLAFHSASAQRSGGSSPDGNNQPAIAALDEVMNRYVERIHCTAATLAIAKNGRFFYRRGYGWLDKDHSVRTPSYTYIGIASCEKPITASAIRKLAREGTLDLDAPVMATLKITPAGQVNDSRVNQITFEHLLEHKAGWGGDIRWELENMARAQSATPSFTMPQLLGFAMTRKLEADPGSVVKYSNFGFDTLRYVVFAESQIPAGLYYRTKLVTNRLRYEVGETWELPLALRTNCAVWNLDDGGPIFASAEYLCAFMNEYWLTGKPRDAGHPLWVMYGSLQGSTAIMVWRPDGVNIAALFNGRNETQHDEIRAALEGVVNGLKIK